jgi:hypothetical protein
LINRLELEGMAARAASTRRDRIFPVLQLAAAIQASFSIDNGRIRAAIVHSQAA